MLARPPRATGWPADGAASTCVQEHPCNDKAVAPVACRSGMPCISALSYANRYSRESCGCQRTAASARRCASKFSAACVDLTRRRRFPRPVLAPLDEIRRHTTTILRLLEVPRPSAEATTTCDSWIMLHGAGSDGAALDEPFDCDEHTWFEGCDGEGAVTDETCAGDMKESRPWSAISRDSQRAMLRVAQTASGGP